MQRHDERSGRRGPKGAPLVGLWVVGALVAFFLLSTIVGVAMNLQREGASLWWLVLVVGIVPLTLLLLGMNQLIRGIGRSAAGGAVDDDPLPERVLTTVLFADIVSSTERLAELGDRRWTDLVADFLDAAAAMVGRHRGVVVDTAGDGVLAAFADPGSAIESAADVRSEARRLGLEVRLGIHSGEVQRIGRQVRGMGVHIGARVIGAAEPGEILVTNTVKELASGSGIRFEDRGYHDLKGVPDPWRLYAVV